MMNSFESSKPRPVRARRTAPWRILTAVPVLLVVTGGMNCTTIDPMPGPQPNPDDDRIRAALELRADDHILGATGAPILVIEYSDFECPFCGRFARETFPTIKQEFIDTGMVRFVYRHFPLRRIHPCAEAAARGSECASDQGQFFEFADVLFADQSKLCNADLKAQAAAAGLDSSRFDACIDSGEKAARVQQNVDSGTQAGVTGTPTFFINGRKIEGFHTVAQFRAELNKG